MKKSEFELLFKQYLSEALEEYGKKPHIKKYRNSKLHPSELGIKQTPEEKPDVLQTREPSFEIPSPVKAMLNGALSTLKKDPTAQKILNGVPVTRKEAIELSRLLVSIPQFPIQQPKKLISLLILLAIENQK